MDITNGGDLPKAEQNISQSRSADAGDGSMDEVIQLLAAKPDGVQKQVTMDSSTYKLTLPQGWVGIKDSYPELPGKAMTEFHPPGKPEFQIAVHYRGMPEDEKSGRSFHDLLEANSNLKIPKVLTPEQVRSLNVILGNVVGDNQYSAKDTLIYGQPRFHLSAAQLIPLNGKTVLSAEGALHDNAGKPLSYFSGVFVDADGTGRKVHEIFLQTKSKEEFEQGKPVFEKALNSVEWN